jgi:ankyrin repeat protein
LTTTSSQDSTLKLLCDRVHGETLLHWTAKFGLEREALLLIANGANAATPNFNDEKPFELAQELVVRALLFKATNPETR